jgi:hypothetical protein
MNPLKILPIFFLSTQLIAQAQNQFGLKMGGNTYAHIIPKSDNPIADNLAQLVQSSASSGTGANFIDAVKGQATNALSLQGQTFLNNLFSTQSGTTEIGATTIQNGLPIYNILLVRPIWESPDKIQTTFTQISAFTQNNRTTGNLGFGYRQFVSGKKILLGANAFYDYEYPYGNQRTSIGGEIRSSVGELNVNYYFGASGWVNTENGMQEKSLGGYNAELAVPLPYMPATKLRASAFNWTGVSGISNTSGTQYSISSPIWNGLSLDVGRVNYSNGAMQNSNYLKLIWIFNADRKHDKNPFNFNKQPYLLEDMETRRYEKVSRQNLIIKAQRNGSFAVGVTGF